jgi:hypothetical protein
MYLSRNRDLNEDACCSLRTALVAASPLLLMARSGISNLPLDAHLRSLIALIDVYSPTQNWPVANRTRVRLDLVYCFLHKLSGNQALRHNNAKYQPVPKRGEA